MPQLASLTNDDKIECISALREDQTDMTEESSQSFWNLHECWEYLAAATLFWQIPCPVWNHMVNDSSFKRNMRNSDQKKIFQIFLIT